MGAANLNCHATPLAPWRAAAPWLDIGRREGRVKHTRVIFGYDAVDYRYADELGLHRRHMGGKDENEHCASNAHYHDLPLRDHVMLDREDAATGVMVGDSSGLFALPIASSDPPVVGRGDEDESVVFGARATGYCFYRSARVCTNE
ncbi:uncharacterized protein PG998_003032 [Apiospora kogelbergensis]|uniref:uncharacterized protein n=1 Tax=Apiospora kogelbergensis TaxID=1337665 RepID=UPI00312CFFDD